MEAASGVTPGAAFFIALGVVMKFSKLVMVIDGDTFELDGSFELDDDVLSVTRRWFDSLSTDKSQTASVLAELKALKEELMPKIDDMLAKLGGINTQTTRIGESLTNVAADIARIKEQLAGGLSPDEADAVVAQLGSVETSLTATADQLKLVADEFPEP